MKVKQILFTALAIISLLSVQISCSKNTEMANSTWTGIDNNVSRIAFYDSTCVIYEIGAQEDDTIRAVYSQINDTIIIRPVDEYVVINSNIYRKGDKLYQADNHKPLFTLEY